MKTPFILSAILIIILSSCSETVDTSKYQEELQARKIKKLTAAEIITFAHSESKELIKDSTFTTSKLVNHTLEAFSIEDCKTQQEKEFYEVSKYAIDQLKEGTDLSNPIMEGDEILVVHPQLLIDSTIKVIYIYMSKEEVIKKMPVGYNKKLKVKSY